MVFNQKKNAMYFTQHSVHFKRKSLDVTSMTLTLIVKVPNIYIYTFYIHRKSYQCLGNTGLGLLQCLHRIKHISAFTGLCPRT